MRTFFLVRFSGTVLLIFQALLPQLIQTPSTGLISEATLFLLFGFLSLLTLLAALGFLFLRPIGWLAAMMGQNVSLLVFLVIYFEVKTVSVQGVLLYNIFMVLYLNSYFVQSAFRTNGDTETGPQETL